MTLEEQDVLFHVKQNILLFVFIFEKLLFPC